MKNRILILAGIMISISFAIFVPEIIIKNEIKKHINVVKEAPEAYYENSKTVMSKNASDKLTDEERISLITGEWKSNTMIAKEDDTCIDMYVAMTYAQTYANELYEKGECPVDLMSGYRNWYRWEAVAYKAIDSSFNTYTAVYWVVTFTKYDNSATYEVHVLENGKGFYASFDNKGFLDKN